MVPYTYLIKFTMISFEKPTDDSLSELRMHLSTGITTLWSKHDAETVATHLMNVLGPDWNQTGVAGNPDFLWGAYWREIETELAKIDRANPFNAPDCVSGIYTNEFILAEELQKAGYTAGEATAVILKMREKENMRQDILHRAAQVGDVTGNPAHPEEAASTAERVVAAQESTT